MLEGGSQPPATPGLRREGRRKAAGSSPLGCGEGRQRRRKRETKQSAFGVERLEPSGTLIPGLTCPSLDQAPSCCFEKPVQAESRSRWKISYKVSYKIPYKYLTKYLQFSLTACASLCSSKRNYFYFLHSYSLIEKGTSSGPYAFSQRNTNTSQEKGTHFSESIFGIRKMY